MFSVSADVGTFVGGFCIGGVRAISARAISARMICLLICVQEPLLALT